MSANQNQVRTYNPQQLVNALSFCVNTDVRNDNSLEQFQTTGDFILYNGFDDFEPVTFSRLVCLYAKYGFKHPSLFNGVANYIVANNQRLDDFETRHLSVLVWAFAKADHRNRALFEVVATNICQRLSLERFSPQSLSNILWAYSTNSYFHQLLFEEVATHISQESQSLEDFNAQQLSNILWAYARIDHVDTQLFNKIAIYICNLRSLTDYNLQDVSMIIWSSAKVGCYHEALFDKIASYIVHDTNLLATEANEKNITMLIWGYATVESSNHPVLFESLTEHVLSLDNLDSFNSFALTNLIWGLNQFTTPPTELLYKVIEAAVARNEAGALVRISNSLFPGEKEICLKGLTNKCTGEGCGKHHLDDNAKLLEILIKLRWKRLIEEGMSLDFIYSGCVFRCSNLSYTILFNTIQKRKPQKRRVSHSPRKMSLQPKR
jgi:hypothetical protein